MWPADPATCPSCREPITPTQWYRCVVIDRAGTRAHKACLEQRGLVMRPDCRYLLARATCSLELLRPSARFTYLLADQVLIDVPVAEAAAQAARLHLAGVGGLQIYPDPLAASRAARGEDPGALRAAQDALAQALAQNQAALQAQQHALQQLQQTLPPLRLIPPAGPFSVGALPPSAPTNLRCVLNRYDAIMRGTLVQIEWDPSVPAPGRKITEYEMRATYAAGSAHEYVVLPTAGVYVPKGTLLTITVIATDDAGQTSLASPPLSVTSTQ